MKNLLTLCMAFSLTACGTISNMRASEELKPWEKNILAEQSMQFPQDKMFSYSDNHIFFSKEASTGGTGVGGGGCGCN